MDCRPTMLAKAALSSRLKGAIPPGVWQATQRARKIGRSAVSIYLPLPAYRRQWLKWGFEEADFENGGSDRLVDAVIAWGDEAKIRDRIAAHRDAGATQMVLSTFNAEGRGPAWKLLELLAP